MYYPVFLKTEGRSFLVIGGGEVGARKVETLIGCGARTGVVASRLTPWLQEQIRAGAVEFVGSHYAEEHLEGRFLVIAATDDPELNRRIARAAEERGILCNVVDVPEEGNFILPALVRRGALTVAVSTSGKSPALARSIRLELEQRYGQEYADFLELMGAVRIRLLREGRDSRSNKERFDNLVHSPLLDLVSRRDRQGVDRILKTVLGEGYSLRDLEISW